MRSTIVYNEGEFANFLRLENQPQDAGLIVLPFERAGVNGAGALEIGDQGEAFTLIGFRDFDDTATAVTDLRALKAAIQGKVVSIWDSAEVEFTNMLCLRVRPGKPQPVMLGVGGLSDGKGALCTVEMDFVHLGPDAVEE